MDTEARRQQGLLQALWSRDDADLDPRGLAAYRGNAAAAAERALAAAFPTVRQLVGDETFGAIARALWRSHPPQRGDLAQWGAALPAWLADAEDLAGEAYLADVARVDLAVHRAETDADAALDLPGLQRLAGPDAERLRLRLAPGAALVVSAHPVVSIWQAHRSQAEDRFAAVRAAFAAGQGETAFVWRRGWRGDVAALAPPETAFVQALLDQHPLGAALDAAPDLDFEAWLARALAAQWLGDIHLPESR
jgi:Putative DNA-binding domain